MRTVRVQLQNTNYLHLREVQVFDSNNVNRALGKSATQSSSSVGEPAERGVNGNLDDIFHTNNEAGKFNNLLSMLLLLVFSSPIPLTLFLFFFA